MDAQQREERLKRLRAEQLADRPRLAAYLIDAVNDASDYENYFTVPLKRSEIYTIYEALKQKAAPSAE